MISKNYNYTLKRSTQLTKYSLFSLSLSASINFQSLNKQELNFHFILKLYSCQFNFHEVFMNFDEYIIRFYDWYTTSYGYIYKTQHTHVFNTTHTLFYTKCVIWYLHLNHFLDSQICMTQKMHQKHMYYLIFYNIVHTQFAVAFLC